MNSKIDFFIKEAGGQKAGNLELVHTSLEQARDYVENELMMDLDKEIPDFDKNYKFAQEKAKVGWTVRADMPVITDSDVKDLQYRLKKGFIDVRKPFSNKFPKDPFPEGLSGETAENWLKAGLKDGETDDDRVAVKMKKTKVSNLKPIQKQIYFDKGIEGIAKFGIEKSIKFYTSTNFITSIDNYIIDGHHRFLGTILIDPNLTVRIISVDLPIKKLLPMSRAYGDAIGNKRNL